jgi:hypothetical protein
MLCEEPTLACIQEECDDCGLESLEPIFRPLREAQDVTFKYRSIEKNEKGRLVVNDKKEGPPSEFVDHLESKITGFPYHRWLAKHQSQELDLAVQELDLEEVIITHDFSEKMPMKENNEIQSMYFGDELLSLLTAFARFLAANPNGHGYIKVKIYFGFLSERPEQDNYMVSHCDRLILEWIRKEFGLTFKRIKLTSDKASGQFCSRKVFGAIADSRRNLCLDHQGSGPLCPKCPQVVIHFSASGHGKCEVDHCGALLKTAFRKEMLAGRVYRSIEDVLAFFHGEKGVEGMDFLDLRHTLPGKEDARGCFYSGMHTEVVLPGDVATPQVDWERIEGTHDLHQLITTATPGELLVREASCFSCPSCQGGDYINCRRTQELGPLERIDMHRICTTIPHAHAATRTRYGQDQHRLALATLAVPGSVIAVALGARQTMTMVLVTKAMGDLGRPDEMKGKKLIHQTSQPNLFTSTNSNIISFNAALVRTPPLLMTSKAVQKGCKTLTIFEINDNEFSALANKFLT